jgi:succinoglycan biosynthesis transport protein ExoP
MDAPVNRRNQFQPSESAVAEDGLKRVLDSLRRHQRLIRTITVVGTLLVAALSFLIPATYLATAQLAIDIRPSANAVASANAEESAIDTHITILLSDAYLRRLLPTLREREAIAEPTFIGGLWSAAKALIRTPPSEDVAALSVLKRNLRAGQERRSKVISVTFADSDPQRAATTANIVVQSYIDEITRQEQTNAETTLGVLAAQSTRIQHDLAQAGNDLKGYRADDPAREALEGRMTTWAQQLEILLRHRQEVAANALNIQLDVRVLATASPPDHPASLSPLLIVPPAAIILALLACLLAVMMDRIRE